MKRCALVFVMSWFIIAVYAQEGGTASQEHEYTLVNYITKAYTPQALKTMQSVVFERVSALQKKNKRSREEHLMLLKNAQLLGSLYTAVEDTAMKEASATVLVAVRDEFISYIAKNKEDYEVKTELAFLVSMAFVAYIQDSYQSIRLIQEVASDVYNNAPNAKAALMLGQVNIGANRTGIPAMRNSLAEKYLNKVIELDGGSGYMSYLAYVYFANLYFKTRKGDAARASMNKAIALYPQGALAHIAEELFFANGKALF